MPDARDLRSDDDDIDARLVESLRALPLAQPGDDGWLRMEAVLRSRVPPTSGRVASFPAHRRRLRPALAWSFAMAAVVMLALVIVPKQWVDSSSTVPTTSVALVSDGERDETTALIAQSQWLERLVASEAIDAGAQDADQLIIEQALRSRIGRIDAALVDAGQPDRRLWAARVGALTQLAEVKWAGRQGSGWAASAAPAAPVPAVMWSN